MTFAVALLRCDVFIFTAGDGFFRGRELPLLRLMGKRIIWVFTGSDHRPPYLSGRFIRQARRDGWGVLVAETRRIAHRVTRTERYSEIIVAHPASAQFHVRPFIQFLALGVPVTVPESIQAPSDEDPSRSGQVRLVHSPSDPASKGTSIIRQIVADMVADGLQVDYTEIIGQPHADVLRTLAKADLLIDEVFGDSPMGVIATEAAFVGVPTVCGGYYAARLTADAPAGVVPPSRFVPPADLEPAIRELVIDGSLRRRLGQEALRFVTQQWQPAAVAARYLSLLDGPIPAGWSYDPRWQEYTDGWGIGEVERRSAIAEFVATAGVESLALPPRSRILDALMAEVAGT